MALLGLNARHLGMPMAPLGSSGPLEYIACVALTQSSLSLVAVVGNKVKQEKN